MLIYNSLAPVLQDFDYFMDRRVFDNKEKYFDSFLTNLKVY